jgi:type VI secretion system secreted protein VgrG
MSDILHVRLESKAFPDGSGQIQELRGRERISQLFEFDLRVIVNDPAGVSEYDILDNPASLIFSRGGTDVRRIYGMISIVKDALELQSRYAAYLLTFVPRAFRMSLTETSEIFMDLSVPDIIEKKLQRAGLVAGEDYKLRLMASYPPREYVVQYQETDLRFISRLAEHIGVSFIFEHDEGRDVIVFTDDNSGFKRIGASASIPYSPRGERTGVFAFQSTTRKLPDKYIVKDYNYRTPGVSLAASAPIEGGAGGQVVEYGAHFKTPEEAERFARVRAEEVAAGRRVFDAESDIQEARPGVSFQLDGHPRSDGEMLIIEVEHEASQSVLGSGGEADYRYKNRFRAIPYATPFRPARVTPKPRVSGVITGVVEAAAEGPYAELDETGRYRVRFPFDTGETPKGKASRPIRMAQPHAGPGYGFHFPLRDGVEVVLTCIDGDPDRPIIAGAVPNAVTPSPVGSKNAVRNIIRTGGGSEINIDDTEDSQRIKLSTPFGGTVLQLGAPNHPGKGAVLRTDEDALVTAKGNTNVHADVTNTVSASNHLHGKAPFVDIEGATKLRLGSPVIEINGGASIDAGADAVKIVGRSSLTGESPTITINGAATVTVFGGSSTFIHGGSDVHITSGTITIEGGTVDVKGGTTNITGEGEVNIKGGTIKMNM